MTTLLPYGRQWIDEADIAEVVRVLRGDFVTCGPDVEAFEKELAGTCGAKHAVAVTNGTAALHGALFAAGVGTGDRVVTSPNTFLASANAAAYLGATPDFSDICPRTYNLCPDALRDTWRGDTKAVVAVDFAGQPCDLPAVAAVARERGALVIEDAAHAIGSRFTHEGRSWRVGGHPWADLTTLSFHPVKHITTGEGGAVLTDDDELAARCRLFRNHGMVRDEAAFEGLGDASHDERGPWYYEMQALGHNHRITDIQCALGRSQLQKLDGFIARRAEIVAQYNEAFDGMPHVVTPHCRAEASPAWHLYVLQLDFEALGCSRTAVQARLRDAGIGTQVHYIPVHLQPYYRRAYGYASGKCPVAEAYYRRCLSLPLFPSMTDADVASVIEGVFRVVHASQEVGPCNPPT